MLGAPEQSAEESEDAEPDTAPEPIANPQYQSFYASVFFDGGSWSIAE